MIFHLEINERHNVKWRKRQKKNCKNQNSFVIKEAFIRSNLVKVDTVFHAFCTTTIMLMMFGMKFYLDFLFSYHFVYSSAAWTRIFCNEDKFTMIRYVSFGCGQRLYLFVCLPDLISARSERIISWSLNSQFIFQVGLNFTAAKRRKRCVCVCV